MKNKLIALCSVFVWQCAYLDSSLAQGRPEEAHLQVTPAFTRILIDSLRQSLSRNYIFPDTALKMSASLEQEYKKGAYAAIKDPQDLARRLEQDLQKAHHDGHLHLRYAPGFARQLSDTTHVPLRQRADDSLALINIREWNYSFTKVEILPGNIGYVQFNGFTGFLREARPTFTGAFRFVAHTKALIIDLRTNGGGSPAMVSQVASYFFPAKMHWNDIISRDRKAEFWTDPAEADSLTLSMPVYILTSKNTFSGAEDFSYGMQSLRRAIIVGDTTGGGAHPTRPFSIGLGYVADIPFARSLNPYTHSDWEGTGVIPDIPVASGKALETTERAILMTQVKEAKTELDTRKAEWQLNSLIAIQGTESLDTSFLASFTGMYQGGLYFYVLGHDLYCKNRERGNAIFQLKHIAGNRFVLDENVQVEFIKDDKGNFSGIKMWWSDGRVSDKPKEK